MAKVGENAAVRSLLALIALAAAVAGQYSLAVQFNAQLAAIGWAVGAAVFVLLYALDARGRELPAASESLPATSEWPLALAVLAVGAFFYTFRLSELPSGLNHDIAWEGLYSASILRGIAYTPYVASAWGRETLMFYFDALAIKLFGMDLFALTLPALVAMLLTLPFFYAFVRSQFGARAALVATLLFATAGWPLLSARVGWRSALQPLFTTMTCMFFWRGMVHARWRDFMLSGIALALTLNTYNAARAFPLLFPLFALFYVLRNRPFAAVLRRYAAGVGVMLLAFTICIAPMAWYAAFHWIEFWGRANSLLANQTPEMLVWTGPRAAALLYNYWGNSDDFFVNTPLLEVPAAVLFVFGLLWCIVRASDARAMFLLLGLFVNLLPGLVTRPNANRGVGTMPFVFCFVGLGLLYFVRQARRLGRAGGVAACVVIAIAGAAQAGATYHEYLSQSRRRIWGFYPDATVVGRFMRTLRGKYAIAAGGANWPRDTLTYLTYAGGDDPFQRDYTWIDDVTVLLRDLPQAPPGQGLALILANIDASPGVFGKLRQRFPQAEVVDLHYPDDGPIVARALLLPPDAAPRSAAENLAEVAKGATMWTGGRGTEPGKFNTPKGLARSDKGEFYVVDTGNHRIQKFDVKGTLIAVWGQFGSTPVSFNEPHAIAIDRAGNVHVVDTWNHRVQKIAPDGNLIKIYAPPKGFFGPRGIAITKDRVYVTDGGNNHVAVFDLDGTFLSEFGQHGSGAGDLFQPVGIAVDRDGLIWVVDSGNNRLQAFHADGTSARTIGVPGWEGDGVKEGYLALTDDGLVLADPVGNRLFRVHGDALSEIPTDNLMGPSGIASDKTTLYITERGRDAVTRLPRKKG
jgi:sugar lactone lactonase YvrE